MARSVMKHNFAQTPTADIPRSSFNLSHGHKTTFDADYLVPVGFFDVIPGDTWNLRMQHFCRLATPLHPIMDNIYIDTFHFFVPYRILWDNFEKFMGAQDDPGDSIDFTIPTCSSGTIATGDLGDYFGLPIGLNVATTTDISCLPFRAYAKIWNDWFRDENLQDSITSLTDNGPDLGSETGIADVPQKRGKRFDYFTSALPWPQKGSNPVSLPLIGDAPVTTDATGVTDQLGIISTTTGNLQRISTDLTDAVYDANTAAASGALYADLDSVTAATINDLRLAFQTQRLLERDARSGTRYVETLQAHWGINNYPDSRLQRPEYLGGSSDPINITPVAQTSGQGTPVADDHLGQLAGFGISSGNSGFTKSFVEHGCIITLINARADITYSQGVDRIWQKSTRYDFYYPVLSQIGEQSILNQEIWHNAAGTDNTDVFGYTERYNEYRHQNSKLSGLFRVDAAGSLDAWHLSEDFATLPTLGSDFITANLGDPLDRAIAVSTEPHFLADLYFDIKAARPLPLYGVPGNLDHF